MSETSPGLAVAWRIAATEAAAAGYQRIECAHLLMGLLSLDKANLKVLKDLGFSAGQMGQVGGEQEAIADFFESAGVSTRVLRRDLRSRVKRKSSRSKGMMSRSTVAKAAFARAETLSAGNASNSLHLLSVLLRDPDPVISSLLVAHGLGPDLADRVEAAAARSIRSVAARREPTTDRSPSEGLAQVADQRLMKLEAHPDDIITVRALDEADVRRIARPLLGALITNVRKTHGVLLRFEPDAEALVIRAGLGPRKGVGELKAAIERLVARPIATLAVSGKLAQHPAWKAVHDDGGLYFLPE